VKRSRRGGGRILYEVSAELHDPSVVEAWVGWMLGEHIDDVVVAGAERGRLLWVVGRPRSFIVQYEFATRRALQEYLSRHAPRLRAEGIRRFGPERVTYDRRVSEEMPGG
jgi:hypothetical protein